MGQIVSTFHHPESEKHQKVKDRSQTSPIESPRGSSPRRRSSSLSSSSSQSSKRLSKDYSDDLSSGSLQGDFLTELQENVADPMLAFPAEKPRNESKVGDVYLLVYKDPRCDLTDTPQQQHQKHQQNQKENEEENDAKESKKDTGNDHSFENVEDSTDVSDRNTESHSGTHFSVLIDVCGESDEHHLIGLEIHMGVFDDHSFSSFSFYQPNDHDLHGVMPCHHGPKLKDSASQQSSTEEKTKNETEDDNNSPTSSKISFPLKSEKNQEKKTLFLANRRVVDRDRLADALFLTKIKNKKKVDSFQWRADLERQGWNIYKEWTSKEGGEAWSEKVNCQRFVEQFCKQAFDVDLFNIKNYKSSFHKQNNDDNNNNENKKPR
jgi:hypothetical protein